MRRSFAILTIFVLLLSLTATVSAGQPADDGVRILLSASNAKAAGVAVRNQFGAKVSAHVTQAQLQALQRRGIAYELVEIIALEPDPGVSSFDAKVMKLTDSKSTPPTQVPWGVKAIYGDPSLTPSGVNGGAGVVVAVLDTGSENHADFTRGDGSSVITGCVDFTSKKAPIIEGSCSDGHGHGTHVTGTVAAAGGSTGQGIFGVAPGASIWSYKVITDKGGGYADDIALGIKTAADRGAQIITMSFGTSSIVPLIQEAIMHAHNKGVLLIAAAGNAGPDPDTIAYPAAFKEVVAVAALNPDESVAWFSSRGITDGNDGSITDREVEVAAPGVDVISTSYKGGYTMKSGTSMAAPHIAGLAAKGWAGTAAETRSWLVSQANAHDATTGYDIASGYGLPQVNVLKQALWVD
ncbi:MAG: S8 family serine peptidase [Bacillota bacterium]